MVMLVVVMLLKLLNIDTAAADVVTGLLGLSGWSVVDRGGSIPKSKKVVKVVTCKGVK